VEVTEPLLTALKPTVVLASVSGWEQTIALDKQYQRMWDGVFDKHTRIKSFTFAVWPFNNPVASERLQLAQRWLDTATTQKHPKGVGTMRFNVLDMSVLLTNKITRCHARTTATSCQLAKREPPSLVYRCWEHVSGANPPSVRGDADCYRRHAELMVMAGVGWWGEGWIGLSAQVASTQSDVCGVRTHGPGEVYGVQVSAPDACSSRHTTATPPLPSSYQKG
jgi:hypothetical protein